MFLIICYTNQVLKHQEYKVFRIKKAKEWLKYPVWIRIGYIEIS